MRNHEDYASLQRTRNGILPFYSSPPRDPLYSQTRVCVVVRTWSGHAATGELERMLAHVLPRLRNLNWHAILVDTDTTPWPPDSSLEQMIARANDSRIVRSHRRASKPFEERYSYLLTDSAIAQCPSDCSWLLVTNADNDHHPDTFSTVDPTFDFVSYDFFSRHWRALGWKRPLPNSCAEFPTSFVRLKNRLKQSHSDLASIIYSLNRFRAESVYFSDLILQKKYHFLDGQMAEQIVAAGWKGKQLDKVLLSHSPNAWECSRGRSYTTYRTVMSANCSYLDETHVGELVSTGKPSAFFQTLDANWEPVLLPCFDDGP